MEGRMSEEPPKRMICCFEASALTKFVGFLQVVGNGLLWLGAGYVTYMNMITLMALSEGEVSEDLLKELELGDSETLKGKFTWLLALSILGLILETVAFVMGFVLLQGLYTKRSDLVGKWIIWAYIFKVIFVILFTVLVFAVGFTTMTLTHYVVIGFVTHGLCIRVVLIHKEDMDQGWDKTPLVET